MDTNRLITFIEYMGLGSVDRFLQTRGKNLSLTDLLSLSQQAAAGMSMCHQSNLTNHISVSSEAKTNSSRSCRSKSSNCRGRQQIYS